MPNGSVHEVYSFNFRWEKLRPGQRGAIDTIRTRVRSGERFTSVVLPTRYGKSDVARLVTLLMMRDGLVSNGLIVAPATNLVEQLLDDSKLWASGRWYGFDWKLFHPTQTINAPPRISRLKTSVLSAITTNMANEHIKTLQHWVYTMRQDSMGPRLRPVVFMDEAHLASDGNRWGNIALTLADAGAHVVVMTATPYRSDGRPIPGFEGIREVLETTSQGKEKVYYDLEPHWETTLQQAMEEDPPPIAQIVYQPFGIEGHLDYIDDETVDQIVLDDLNDADIRRAYRESLRDPVVIDRAVRYFLTELSNRRRDPKQSKASGIVFVGNFESEFDSSETEHAVRVKTIVNQLAPRLRCEIIVSSDANAQNLLNDFIGEKVDVAIVKQMGAIGLDAAHLKVALDLSNTRSRAYFLQRLMRIATRWEPEGFKNDPVLVGTYIAPDDRITLKAVEDVFEGTTVLRPITEGFTPADDRDLANMSSRDTDEVNKPHFVADDVVLTGHLRDTKGTEAPAVFIPPADSFNEAFPEMTNISKARVAKWLQGVGVDPDAYAVVTDTTQVPTSEPSQASALPSEPTTLDMTKELDDEREKVSTLGRKAINARFRRSYGDYNASTRAQYGKVASRFWSDHFYYVGLPRNHKLENVDDSGLLREIYGNIESELRGVA